MPNMTQAGYTPPKPEQRKTPAEPKKKKHAKKKKGRKRMSGAAAVSLAIFFAAVLVGAATIYLYTQTQPYVHAYLPGTSLDRYPLGGATQEDALALLERTAGEAVSAWRFEMTCMGQTYTITAQDVALSIDRAATLDPLWALGRDGNMLSRYLQMLELRRNPVDAQSVIAYDMAPVDALLERIAADIEREPVDASMTFVPSSSMPFRFEEERTGLSLDTDALRAQIGQAISSLTTVSMTLVPQEIEPAVRRSDLENAVVLRTRLVTEIASDEASYTNVRIAAGKLHGLSIGPGETLSLNDAIGRRTPEAGYAVAPEPAYGVDVSGVGGGVCQVSTAAYRAALLGGLEILERHAAVRPVDYCGMGQEAAISDQGLDLVLANPTAHPLFMTARTYRDGGAAFIELQLIGEPLAVRYALESAVTQTELIEEPVYVRDRDGQYARYTDERVSVGKALPGYQADVVRTAVGKDGKEERVVISSDVYEAVPPAIYVGIEEREEK